MKGAIRTKQKCPRCRKPFRHYPRLAIVCDKCKTKPDRFFIDLGIDGVRHRIFSDKAGLPISSYDHAFYIQEKINEELSAHKFDPSHWLKGEAKRYMVPDLASRFYAARKSDIAPSDQVQYENRLDRCAGFFQATDIRDLRAMDIFNLVEELKKTLHGKTLKNYLTTFHAFLGWTKALGVIDAIPAFPTIEIQQAPPAWLKQEDQEKVFQAVPEADRPLIAFLMLHGCRPGEARALRIRDVDISKGIITVTSTWSRTTLRARRKGKNAQPFLITIHQEMMPWISQRVREALPGAFLFINPRSGDPYSSPALKKVWAKVREKAGVDLKLYNATRHSFGSQLANAGVPLLRIAGYLGHSSVSMTQRFYAHADRSQAQIDLAKISLRKVVGINGTSTAPGEVGEKARAGNE